MHYYCYYSIAATVILFYYNSYTLYVTVLEGESARFGLTYFNEGNGGRGEKIIEEFDWN